MVYAPAHEEYPEIYIEAYYSRNGPLPLYYKTDGLIFVQELSEYHLDRRKGDQLIKWKFPGTNTLDFKINVVDNYNYQLQSGYRQGTRQMTAPFTQRFLNHTGLGIEINNQIIKNHGEVAEFAFIPYLQKWLFVKPRKDKKYPNAVSTLIQTMGTIVDNITLEEIRNINGMVIETEIVLI